MSVLKGKVVLVGDTSVGKTAIVNCFNKLSTDVQPTVGANSITCHVTLDDGRAVTLNVWDTAGQDDFKCLVPMYARCAQVAIVVFDQSLPSSYESVDNWIQYMKDEVQVPNVFLVANKQDLDEAVDINQAINYAQEKEVTFCRTSAITGCGVDALFQSIAEVVSAPEEKQETVVEPVFPKPVSIDDPNHKKSGCC